MKLLKTLEEERTLRIIVSAVLGLGFALMFRTVCHGDHCVIVNGPSKEEIEKYYYKMDNTCYKYKPLATKCV